MIYCAGERDILKRPTKEGSQGSQQLSVQCTILVASQLAIYIYIASQIHTHTRQLDTHTYTDEGIQFQNTYVQKM